MKEITQGQYAAQMKKKNHKLLVKITDDSQDENVSGYLVRIRGKYYEFTNEEWQKTFDDLDRAMEGICS